MQSFLVLSHHSGLTRWQFRFVRIVVLFSVFLMTSMGLVQADDTGLLPSDDTAIFGGTRPVKPNVLFILDNSSTMTATISGSYVWGPIFQGKKRRIDIVQYALTSLIDSGHIDNARIGLMLFNNWTDIDSKGKGGRIVVPIGDLDLSKKMELHDQINRISKDSLTPSRMAETLAEAGLYFAGLNSWVDDVKRPSPIQWRCQQNYVIYVTSGGSTYDRGNDGLGNAIRNSIESLFGNIDNLNLPGSILFSNSYFYAVNDPTVSSKSIEQYSTDPDDDIEVIRHKKYEWWQIPAIERRADLLGWLLWSEGGSRYLDNVAKYLYDIDLMPSSANDLGGVSFGGRGDATNKYWQQNVKTFVLGLPQKGSGSFLSDTSILRSAADESHGHGKYYEVDIESNSGPQEFVDAITEVMTIIYNGAFSYSATAVPVSSSSMFFSGHSVYVPMFVPDTSNLWLGNLRKYALNGDGTLYDVNGLPVVDDSGLLLKGAKDFWTKTDVSGADYSQVNYGGVGSVLTNQASRHLYTAVLGTPTALSISLDPRLFGLASNATADRDKLINYLCCADTYAPGGSADRKWVLGDIMHSIPAVLNEPANKSAIFVGANDGLLHCFVDVHGSANDTWEDSDGDGQIDMIKEYNTDGTIKTQKGVMLSDGSSIEELWAFAPPELLPRLKYLHPDFRKDPNYKPKHEIYVDGSPVIYKVKEGNAYSLNEARGSASLDYLTHLIFGLRRGGVTYTILDIPNVDRMPGYIGIDQVGLVTKFRSDEGLSALTPSSGTAELKNYLGGSWSTPVLAMVKDDDLSGAYSYRKIIFLAGGYDDTSTVGTKTKVFGEDAISGAGEKTSTRLKGSCAYALDAASGNVFTVFSRKDMLDSIVDLVVFDRNNDRIADTLYAPDLGGRLWRFQASGNGNVWTAKKIFEPSIQRTYPLKFFNAPDVVLEPGYEYLFIGSGNREDPLRINNTTNDGSVSIDPHNQERFYALKFRNQGTISEVGGGLSNEITDITDATYASQAASIQTNTNGWFLCLTAPGEKVINRAVTVRGVVFFTTYQPFSNTGYAAGTDLCSPKVQNGVTRLYAINYRNGNAVKPTKEFEADNDPFYKSGLNDDRSLVLGQAGLPPQPSLVVTDNGMSLVVGSKAIPLNIPSVATAYYWHYLD